MQQIKLMRKYGAQVHAYKHTFLNGRLNMGSNLVEDRGACVQASRGSAANCYSFSNTPMGVRPLVLIGTLAQIDDFFRREANYGIVNEIMELPMIYVRAARYRAGERFKELAAGHATTRALIDTFKTGVGIMADPVVDRAVAGVVPDHTLGQASDGAITLANVVKGVVDATMASDGAIQAARSLSGGSRNPGGPEFYVEFSYMQGSGTKRVGTHRLSFSDRDLFWTLAELLCNA
ncbi:hypothetical protein AKI39_21215 [Bordetella sp. H567]|uniref:hypothetical protein n=1 Tax=Bordetella sp. H567 TaxID=1697043 RepID=UPI00081CB963|nr:hypothetical protein [Bordetella sp. H567]AOB32722.1 hypothetical protein AKI39_21215 [Bordetella sp. H567]